MIPFTISSFVRTLFIVFFLSSVKGHDRKITGKLHPGCDSCTDKDTLVYIKAEGAEDTIHQIWDFTRNAPTIILTVGGVNSTMDILWEGAYPVKFTMNEKPKYSFATAFDKLYEYDDILDNGYIDWRSPRREVPLTRATWTLRDQVMTEDEVMVHVQGRLWEEKTSLIDVKFDLLPYADYAADLPHLIHTANSTLIDLSLVNLTTSRDYNASRFAARLLMVSVDARNDTMRYTMRKSLDDEHTPGVFEIVEIKSPGSLARGAGGFLQFRPVAYTQECRGVASSTYVHVSPFNRTRIPERSSVRTFYSDFEWSSLLVQDVLVSFGEPGDGYYAHHNYTSWSLTVGYGAPPIEGFSPFVIAIIACGLGLPILLALSGALYALLRRRRRNTPTRFVDDQ